MVMSDAIIRLLDGVILEDSHADDSFENGLLEYPQYTRPIEFEGRRVPESIAEWSSCEYSTLAVKTVFKENAGAPSGFAGYTCFY